MRKIKKICVVTGSRADYGLLYWLMKEIKENSDMKLIPVATGVHLSKKYGYTVNEIIKDGFRNVVKINILSGDTSPAAIAKSIGEGIKKFSDFFAKNKIDFLFLLGDRFEILAAALAALPFNIPIAHSSGGEISEGAIDDIIRHVLTKLSHLHFPITKKCGERIKRLGEESWRIKVVGSLSLDFMHYCRYKSKQELQKKFNINFQKKTAVATYHPVTRKFWDTERQINNLINAFKSFENIEIIMLYPNIDTSSDIIVKEIKKFAKSRPNIKLFTTLVRQDYLSILNAIDIMIGNSSSGLIEAPSFKLPVVNIGERQKGRDHVKNVINVGYSTPKIIKAIKKGLYDKKFIASLKNLKNSYGDGRASKRIAKILSNIDLDKFSIIKKFR